MIKRLISSILLILFCATATPAMALAYNPFDNVNCSSAPSSAVCTDKGNQQTVSGPKGVIITAANFISVIAGIAAVIIIIVSAIQFVVSGGDPQSVAGARNTIIGALIGIAVIILARTIVVYVVNKI